MFRRDSCAFYALRFILFVLLFLYGMQWVLGRLFPFRRFLTLPSVHAAPLGRVTGARRAASFKAPAKSLACADAAARSVSGQTPPPKARR